MEIGQTPAPYLHKTDAGGKIWLFNPTKSQELDQTLFKRLSDRTKNPKGWLKDTQNLI